MACEESRVRRRRTQVAASKYDFSTNAAFRQLERRKLLLYHLGRTSPCCVRRENKLGGSTFIVSKLSLSKRPRCKFFEFIALSSSII